MQIGIDEVGRGCLAGDLVVVAYAFKPDADKKMLRMLCADSKSFKSRLAREKSFDVLVNGGIYHLARRSPSDIDRLNIRGATLDAMKEAAETVLSMTGEAQCLFDGRDIPPLSPLVHAEAIIKGDSKIAEIGAASIIAKVIRDREMESLAKIYPGYAFEKNAGYGTKAHCEAIKALGLTPIHRSWARKFL